MIINDIKRTYFFILERKKEKKILIKFLIKNMNKIENCLFDSAIKQ